MRDEKTPFHAPKKGGERLNSSWQEEACKEPDTVEKPWKVMVIDDDEMMHELSRMVLSNVIYNGRGIEIIDGYSGDEARHLLAQHPDTALLLLDVVMETETVGLEVVKYTREELKNQFVRIILRTGQAALLAEHRVIAEYDINDYKEKAELTAEKLYSTVIVTLRAYDDLKKIEALSLDKVRLESMVAVRTQDLRIANEDINRSKAYLAEAQRIAQIGHWEWLIDEGRCECSQQAQQIMGIDGESSNPGMLINMVPGDEQKRLIATMEAAVKGHIPYDIEHYLQRPDGTQLLVRHRGEPVLDEKGEIKMLIGTIQDITLQRLADEEMRKLSGAIRQAADAVMITDYSGKIEYVNPAFEEMTGYSSIEMMGRTPRLLKSDKQSPAFYKRMWKIICRGGVFSDTVINQRKNGSLYYEEKTITPLKDANGKISNFISTGRDITERIEAQQKLFHLAHHDALTGLPNRVLLQDRLNQLLSRIRHSGRKAAILFIDLDRFKVINDTLGHDVGDRLLQAVSERLVECVQEKDTVARLGGDEYAIVLNDVVTREAVDAVAKKILEQMGCPFMVGRHELFITASIGIVLAPDNGDDTQSLLKKADKAMYHAKESGKNRFQFYTQGENTAFERLTLETALRHAMQKQEFVLHYQPQVSLKNGKMCGVEALLRWRHETFKDLSPAHFMPLLEETGMIVDVGAWVLASACQQAAQWKSEGIGLRVAVNLSARQFQQPDFFTTVVETIESSGAEASLIELEITEGMLIDNIEKTTKLLQKFHDMGIRIAIDDFGTGFSSMSYLKQLPVDLLKIDRCFIKEISENRSDAAIAAGMIHLAHSLDLEVIAEGVENRAQLELLHEKGLDQIQGYLYSPAVPGDEIALLMQQHETKWNRIISGI